MKRYVLPPILTLCMTCLSDDNARDKNNFQDEDWVLETIQGTWLLEDGSTTFKFDGYHYRYESDERNIKGRFTIDAATAEDNAVIHLQYFNESLYDIVIKDFDGKTAYTDFGELVNPD